MFSAIIKGVQNKKGKTGRVDDTASVMLPLLATGRKDPSHTRATVNILDIVIRNTMPLLRQPDQQLVLVCFIFIELAVCCGRRPLCASVCLYATSFCTLYLCTPLDSVVTESTRHNHKECTRSEQTRYDEIKMRSR